jgi:hypothetical protein
MPNFIWQTDVNQAGNGPVWVTRRRWTLTSMRLRSRASSSSNSLADSRRVFERAART